jgi:hypothetical protein
VSGVTFAIGLFIGGIFLGGRAARKVIHSPLGK